jgi:hypothetical protein
VRVLRESAFQVELKAASMLRRGNGNVEEEHEGHVGTLGSICLDTPSATQALVRNYLRSSVRVTVGDKSVVSKRGYESLRIGWHGGSIYIVYE